MPSKTEFRLQTLVSGGPSAPIPASMPSIAFFGHDSDESTVIKRARAFQAHGARLIGFMFRRERNKRDEDAEWENIPLGLTVDRNYIVRVPKLLLAVLTTLRHRKRLKSCDIIYARNLDMLLIAVLAKALSGAEAPVVYEVLDVRRIFIGTGLASRAFRWAERVLMRATSLMVTSAPEFVTEFYQPAYGFKGRWFLLENKLPEGSLSSELLAARRRPPPGPPWSVGMFGVLRDAKSLGVLCHAAEMLGGALRISFRGILSETDVPAARMEEICRRLPDVSFGGAYRNPQDLPEIYGNVHFVWASDFLDPGGNSEWCLTNRIYEGGMMGAVLLGARGNATGRMIEEHGLGFTFAEPLGDNLAAFFRQLDARAYLQAAAQVEEADPSLFTDMDDTKMLLRELADLAKGASR